MSDEFHQEIFREELPMFRSIYLRVSPTGAVRIDAQDMGKNVEETWGDSDYEFWVDVPEAELQKLLFALLKAKYVGRVGAVDEFQKFCQGNSIGNEWGSWA
jgi:hypothetical protein